MSNDGVAPETLAVGALAASATVPIVWDETHDGRTAPAVGTGTLFRILGRNFLVTAAHVMEGESPKRRVLYPDGQATELHGVLGRVEHMDSHGCADVAVALLVPDVARELEARGRQFLSENNLPSLEVARARAHFFAGFPAEGLDWRQPRPTVFALAERPAPTDLAEKADPELHFFLSYGERVRNAKGDIMGAPRLHGVSGATIWGQVVPKNRGVIWHAADHVRVFGIETAVGASRSWIRCTSIGVAANMMCKIDPELRPIIEPRFIAQGSRGA